MTKAPTLVERIDVAIEFVGQIILNKPLARAAEYAKELNEIMRILFDARTALESKPLEGELEEGYREALHKITRIVEVTDENGFETTCNYAECVRSALTALYDELGRKEAEIERLNGNVEFLSAELGKTIEDIEREIQKAYPLLEKDKDNDSR